jgi:hypothetical protein
MPTLVWIMTQPGKHVTISDYGFWVRAFSALRNDEGRIDL